ncbi:MAG: M48 family metalloprotease [Verrucomicrobiae bacterium]|jgi:hypothetical protein|nr:M48 family metalloprotease [Verrucomicrobiae bacterium]
MAAARKYPARAVSTIDEEDAYPGTLSVEPDTVVFTSSSLTFRLPYPELILDFTNKRNSAVSFQHPDHPQWRITAYEHRVLRERPFTEHSHLRQQIRDVRSRHQGVGQVISTIFFVALLIGIGYLAGYAVESSVAGMLKNVSPAQDARIGEILRPIVGNRFPPASGYTSIEAQLDAILMGLIPEEEKERFNFKCHVLATEEIISFALPGGDLYFSAGLLRLVPDVNILAGVLAHEAGHVLNRHAVRAAVTRKGASMILRGLLGDEDGIARTVAQAGPDLIAPVYPVMIDLEADETAWSLLLKAGIAPTALTTFLSAVNDRNYSEVKEERPHPSLLPGKARWASLEQKQLALDKEIKFEPLPPLDPLPPPAASASSLDL